MNTADINATVNNSNNTATMEERLAALRQRPNYKRIAGLPLPDDSGGSCSNEEDDLDHLSFLASRQQPRPVLGDAALYGPMGEIIRLLAPHTEADPAAMYAQLFTCLGNIVGRGAWFVADGARHHANFFVVVTGRTAKARKGTSWARVEQPVEKLDPQWFEERIKGGVVSGEGVIQAFQVEAGEGEEPQQPQDKRLLLKEGEFGQVLQVMKREGSTVSILLRNAWDGGKIAVLRRKDALEVSGAHISLVGHITLMELHRLLASVEISNGLANRCLWVYAERMQRLPRGGGEPDLSAPLAELYLAIQSAAHRGEVTLDEAAWKLWDSLYEELGEEPEGTLGEILSRGEAQVMRLAFLLALLDQAPAIQCRHLEAAMAFWRYCVASATYIFSSHLMSPRAHRIREALRNGPLTMSDIHKLLGNNATRREIEEALGELAGSVELARNPGKGGGQVIRLTTRPRVPAGADEKNGKNE